MSCLVEAIVAVVLLFLHFQAIHATTVEINRVCYHDPPIGCFSNKYPFNYTDRLPHSPDEIDVHYIHTIHQDNATFHWRDAKQVMRKRFRPELKTIIIIHGFIEFGTKPWVVELVAEFAKLTEAINIIVVDWRAGAQVTRYTQAATNGRVVSAMGALLVRELIAMGASPMSFHVIGNSLGAHLAGNLGARIPGLGRVTAFDPSHAYLVRAPPEARLDASDAMMVDVIHTDGGEPFNYGTLIPMGTVDFYANGGFQQPGCSDTLKDIVLDLFVKGKEKCSHSRAIELFRDSISTCVIHAHKCINLIDITSKVCGDCSRDWSRCVRFGYRVEPNARGMYAFFTGSQSPFCDMDIVS